MSLFSNEQKHRKINRKNQGSCLDLASKGFFFAITESRDKDYYNQHHTLNPTDRGMWLYTSALTALATENETGVTSSWQSNAYKKLGSIHKGQSFLERFVFLKTQFFFNQKKKFKLKIHFVGLKFYNGNV